MPAAPSGKKDKKPKSASGKQSKIPRYVFLSWCRHPLPRPSLVCHGLPFLFLFPYPCPLAPPDPLLLQCQGKRGCHTEAGGGTSGPVRRAVTRVSAICARHPRSSNVASPNVECFRRLATVVSPCAVEDDGVRCRSWDGQWRLARACPVPQRQCQLVSPMNTTLRLGSVQWDFQQMRCRD